MSHQQEMDGQKRNLPGSIDQSRVVFAKIAPHITHKAIEMVLRQWNIAKRWYERSYCWRWCRCRCWCSGQQWTSQLSSPYSTSETPAIVAILMLKKKPLRRHFVRKDVSYHCNMVCRALIGCSVAYLKGS